MSEKMKRIWCIFYAFGAYSLVLLANALIFLLFGETVATLLFMTGLVCAIISGIWYAIVYWRAAK